MSGGRRVRMLAWAAALLLVPTPAYADNCSALSDCYGQIAVAVLVALALGIAIYIAIEYAAASAAAAAIEAEAAAAVAEVEAEAAAAAARAAAVEAAAAAEAAELAAAETAFAEAAGAPAVTLEQAAAEGLVNPAGKLGGVLNAMEQGFAASPPSNLADAMRVLGAATRSVGLGSGQVVGGSVTEGVIIRNVGGVFTQLLPNGEIIVERAGQILLHLIP